jgi:hypothetical protein
VVNPPALDLNSGAPSLNETVNGSRFETITNRIRKILIFSTIVQALRPENLKIFTLNPAQGCTMAFRPRNQIWFGFVSGQH